jgi:hypothetical protein
MTSKKALVRHEVELIANRDRVRVDELLYGADLGPRTEKKQRHESSNLRCPFAFACSSSQCRVKRKTVSTAPHTAAFLKRKDVRTEIGNH